MQYSLLSRFQGCLLGMVIGEQWEQSQLPDRVNFSSSLEPSNPDNRVSGWSGIALELLQGMTQSHQWQSAELPTRLLSQMPKTQRDAAPLAIATLPLALYFHDDLNRQRHTVRQWGEALALDEIQLTWITVFAYAIAQAIKGQLEPGLLIPQILAYVRVTTPESTSVPVPVLTTLEGIATAQANATSLVGLLTAGLEKSGAIAIALTCFLQTPDDLRLALTRASHLCAACPTRQDTAIIHALTGALIGAYTSLAGIPPTAQLSPALPTLMPLADALVASWSGVYNTRAIAPPLPVAAPWVIRP